MSCPTIVRNPQANNVVHCLLIVLSFALFACDLHSPHGKNSNKSSLVGEWKNTYMKVTMESFRNSDSTKIIEVDESNWEEKLKAKTVRTFFREDGTYNSEHRDLNDSIFYNPAGKWRIEGDSLYMTDTFPEKGISYTYWLQVNDSIAEFRGLEDFDQDGNIDDQYIGRQRRQRN